MAIPSEIDWSKAGGANFHEAIVKSLFEKNGPWRCRSPNAQKRYGIFLLPYSINPCVTFIARSRLKAQKKARRIALRDPRLQVGYVVKESGRYSSLRHSMLTMDDTLRALDRNRWPEPFFPAPHGSEIRMARLDHEVVAGMVVTRKHIYIDALDDVDEHVLERLQKKQAAASDQLIRLPLGSG